MISNDPYSRGAVRPYNSRPNEPLELSADPVLENSGQDQRARNRQPEPCRMISNDPYSRGTVRPYNSRPNEPLEISADPVLGLIGG
ncbi:hypothetical protein CDAR_603171 [Caerostris darwini]|uniref:Uncharacterized protein n=1 Tax=Caerostris darwini TaxID=1538125 RepID=A0AAV4RE55_9ARAC|nr:hypothetical protein CDAR_603171 [Caerostris darwini]